MRRECVVDATCRQRRDTGRVLSESRHHRDSNGACRMSLPCREDGEQILACDVRYSSYLPPHGHPLSLQLQFSPLQLGYNFHYFMCHTLNPLWIIILLQLSYRHKVTIILLQAIISPKATIIPLQDIISSQDTIMTLQDIISSLSQ